MLFMITDRLIKLRKNRQLKQTEVAKLLNIGAVTYNRYEKVAAFLLDQIQYDQQQEISYTHEEMASLLGLSRVTVTKVLNEFEKEKMILLQYKTIVIKDKNKLYSLLHK